MMKVLYNENERQWQLAHTHTELKPQYHLPINDGDGAGDVTFCVQKALTKKDETKRR